MTAMKSLILSLILVTGASAHAIYLEPYIGYNSGSINSADDELGDIDTNAIDIGARVGYGMLGFAFGLDYAMNLSGSFDGDNSDGDLTSASRLSVFGLYEFPVLVRGYAGYTFSEKFTLEPDGSAQVNSDILEGSGLYFGAGYTGLPFITINFELHRKSFKKAENSVINKLDLDSTDFNYWLLSVSVPL